MIRCQFPINHAQLIAIAQNALRLPLRKKFYDVQFNEFQELVIASTSLESRGNYNSLGNGIELCVGNAAMITTHFKPLMVKGLVQSIKGQKIVMNDADFVPIKPPKYQTYSFNLTKATDIYEELVRPRVILPNSTKKMPKPEELRGKKYCKSRENCLEKPQANMMIDTDSFPKALINMINLNWVEKGKGEATWDEKGERRQDVKPSEGVKRLLDKPQPAVVK
ncbi:unnamed protein product [Malus baccata var. baccata]